MVCSPFFTRFKVIQVTLLLALSNMILNSLLHADEEVGGEVFRRLALTGSPAPNCVTEAAESAV